MPPGTFSVISGGRPDSVGVVAEIFRDLHVRTRFSGGVVAEIFAVTAGTDQSNSPSSGTFFYISGGHLQITRHLCTLTEIPGHFAGLLTHSKNVTTSIHWRKKTFTKSLGGGAMAPVGPPDSPLLPIGALQS